MIGPDLKRARFKHETLIAPDLGSDMDLSILLDGLVRWASRADVPNGLFLLALLTAPATWSRLAEQQLQRLEQLQEGEQK